MEKCDILILRGGYEKITDKGRRLLRKIYTCVGAAAVSVLFQACYGPFMDDYSDEVRISGNVRCKETSTPIPGIDISVQQDDFFSRVRTSKDGNFNFMVPRGLCTFEITDVDEEYNGGFFRSETKEVDLTDCESYSYSMDIDLEKEAL